jgi:hypothetical protein
MITQNSPIYFREIGTHDYNWNILYSFIYFLIYIIYLYNLLYTIFYYSKIMDK